MRIRWMVWGLLALSTGVWAGDERYQAFPLIGAQGGQVGQGGQGGGRAFILDTRDGHVWVWSENELLSTPDGRRRYGAGFIYQGKLRPGTQPGELIEQQAR